MTESRTLHVEPESETGFYDHPAWYDVLHAPGTAAQVDMLERLHRQYGNGGMRFLEPACGTGRHLRVLAQRGYDATGYDINDHMLDYARRRLQRLGLSNAHVLHGDMTTFQQNARFDVAFNLINTFRHLVKPADVRAHLDCIGASLRRGGLYILGVDLVDYDCVQHQEDVWAAQRGSCRVDHVMMSLPPTRRQRIERIINHITVTTPKRQVYFSSAYALRSYDLRQWKATLKESPFEQVASFDFEGARLGELDATTRDLNAVLRKR